jgi:hypothetical protein
MSGARATTALPVGGADGSVVAVLGGSVLGVTLLGGSVVDGTVVERPRWGRVKDGTTAPRVAAGTTAPGMADTAVAWPRPPVTPAATPRPAAANTSTPATTAAARAPELQGGRLVGLVVSGTGALSPGPGPAGGTQVDGTSV